MTREEEIIIYAKEHEKQAFFCDLVKSDLAKGVNSAYGIGFIEGAVWGDKTMIEKACEWLEPVFKDLAGYNCAGDLIEDFKKAMEGGEE